MMTRSLLGSVTGRSAFTWSAVTGAAPLPQPLRTKLNASAISLVGELHAILRHAIGVGRALDDERLGAVQHEIDE